MYVDDGDTSSGTEDSVDVEDAQGGDTVYDDAVDNTEADEGDEVNP